MRILDLFCGAGGAAVGYHRAGFEVVGVDSEPQPNYPFPFVQADALDYMTELLIVSASRFGRDLQVDAIHASPPCQGYMTMNRNMPNGREHRRLVAPIRDLLQQTGLPYVIENVQGSPLLNPSKLCGTSFGLGVTYNGPSAPEVRYDLRRHRFFETGGFALMTPRCLHHDKTIGIYGDHARYLRRSYGPGEGQFSDRERLPLASEAMGIDWMSWDEIREAIPPAYTELIGWQLRQHLEATGADLTVRAPTAAH